MNVGKKDGVREGRSDGGRERKKRERSFSRLPAHQQHRDSENERARIMEGRREGEAGREREGFR